MGYEIIPTEQLKPFFLREIRSDVIEKIKERIKQGFNPARPLTVVKNGDGYHVADGNHRLQVINEMRLDQVPCVVYKDADLVQLAVKANQDEDTYAPMDLFDWLDVIKKEREQGSTQQEIAKKIGWTLDTTKKYNTVFNVVPEVLEKAKSRQKGRGTGNVPNGTFNFTVGWFRESGIYELKPEYQKQLMQRFIKDKCKWNNQKVKTETAKYKAWQEWATIAKDELANLEDLPTVVQLIENNSFRTESQLLSKIRDLNAKAENKLICGDAIRELESLEDGTIDLVITDPPYGIDYSSNRSEDGSYITREKIANDGDIKTALTLMDDTLQVLMRKTKPDTHFYLFTSWKVYPEFMQVIEKYLDVKNLIIWDKGNHGTGDLEGAWGNRYEMVIFATKGSRKLNKRKPDIIQVPKLPSGQMIHPTQKPIQVIMELLEASARQADTVCDPFMGSGSTIKAVKEFGHDLKYIGIELDRERFEKAAAYIGG